VNKKGRGQRRIIAPKVTCGDERKSTHHRGHRGTQRKSPLRSLRRDYEILV
jgi:hypothetical protein